MADQPVQTPAADGTTPTGTPQQPSTSPADQPPAAQSFSFDSFSDDDKKYLAGQGITKQEELTQDSLVKVLNHARSSQKTAQERQAEIDRLKGTPQSDPIAPTGQPSATNPPATTPTQPTQGLDDVTALNLATSLSIQFPELKDQLVDGSFYKNMNDLGIPTAVDGKINLNGIINYGKLAQERAQTAAKLTELEKPREDDIPSVNGGTPTQPADDATMTKQMAQAILLQDPNHKRADEARQFLQGSVKQ